MDRLLASAAARRKQQQYFYVLQEPCTSQHRQRLLAGSNEQLRFLCATLFWLLLICRLASVLAESDSANLDHMAELLVRTGFEPQESLMLLVPEAFRNHPDLMKEYPEVRLSVSL